MRYTLDNFHPEASSSALHVGLIPDGTRRWARAQHLTLAEGYLRAAQTLARCLRCFYEGGCASASVYLLSVQNLRRSPDDLAAAYQALEQLCGAVLPPLAAEYDTAVQCAGQAELLPSAPRQALAELQERTRAGGKTRLYLCVAYNPLQEIVDAVRAGGSEGFVEHLAVPQPLDLVIRTGGANLLSNFLPLQAGYARFYNIRKLFNEVTDGDLRAIIEEFRGLHRRFGE